MVLNSDFKYVLHELENGGRNMFITGRAGSGKSTLLNLYRKTTQKKTVILAPTGVAALHVGGQTIHSFFGFPPRLITPDDAKKKIWFRPQLKLVQELQVLVVDEISMVRADMLDGMDLYLRFHRNNPKPFGGVQVVFFGDLFQLPPVVNRDPLVQMHFTQFYDSAYFFSAHCMPSLQMEMVELKQVYRQDSRHFLRLLEAVRTATFDQDDLDDLNQRHDEERIAEAPSGYVTLCARNATADSINQLAIKQLPGPEVTFTAEVEGQFDEKLFPTEPLLSLREGAQVMFIRNDSTGDRYVNGTVGRITELRHDKVVVELDEETRPGEGRIIEVEKAEWEIVRYKTDERGEIQPESIGKYRQIPLRLAWAITIHKSQGKTFDKVIVDLGNGAFEHGQLYVALSRCRTLDGILLRRPIQPRDVIMDEKIVEFYETYFRM